ncbi:hypothetical protein, partial [uncultured Duncaniella sp.]|uniref:hypothetical protein n=1 Tax=uncultured Duncaniella sp. TaxID=2768039 RepID=UPI0025EF9DE2
KETTPLIRCLPAAIRQRDHITDSQPTNCHPAKRDHTADSLLTGCHQAERGHTADSQITGYHPAEKETTPLLLHNYSSFCYFYLSWLWDLHLDFAAN